MTAAVDAPPERGRSVADYAVFIRVVDGVELFRCVGACKREMQPAVHGGGPGVLAGVPKHDSHGKCQACATRARRGVDGPPKLAKVGLTVVHTLLDGLGTWIERAACKAPDADPDAFAMPDRWAFVDPPAAAVQAARTYCATCPVLAECDDFAERNSAGQTRYYRITGLWGGRWRTATTARDVPMRDDPKRRPRRQRRRSSKRAAA